MQYAISSPTLYNVNEDKPGPGQNVHLRNTPKYQYNTPSDDDDTGIEYCNFSVKLTVGQQKIPKSAVSGN